MSALYSLENQTDSVGKLIRSIVVEEMKHLTIVSNILNALGVPPPYPDPKNSSPDPKEPDGKNYIPEFPTHTPLCFDFRNKNNTEWKEFMDSIPILPCNV